MAEQVKQKRPWEMTYGELWQAWEAKNAFGAKGELSVHEAKQVHSKWKTLGTLARKGLL